MVLSMTGFGKAEADYSGRNISVAVKSVNGKLSDVNVRLPFAYREKENEIRSLINKKLERGKVDIFINTDKVGADNAQTINKAVFSNYFDQLKVLTADKQVDDAVLFAAASRFPNILSAEKDDFDQAEWSVIEGLLQIATDQVMTFRKTEGAALEKDLRLRIENISQLQLKAKAFEKERVQGLRNKIEKQLEELPNKEKIDRDRFEQEMLYYMERLDITEENVRLSTHCKFFLDTMDGEESQGKKLNFIAQEIGREINTVGSKSNHAGMQKLVVEMKDELEKIKEQLLNVL